MNGTALVTGAASGIGEATTIKLCASGWTVAAVDIDPDGLAALARRVSGMQAHMCDVATRARWIACRPQSARWTGWCMRPR